MGERRSKTEFYRVFRESNGRALTTDYVRDETSTLLHRRSCALTRFIRDITSVPSASPSFSRSTATRHSSTPAYCPTPAQTPAPDMAAATLTSVACWLIKFTALIGPSTSRKAVSAVPIPIDSNALDPARRWPPGRSERGRLRTKGISRGKWSGSTT